MLLEMLAPEGEKTNADALNTSFPNERGRLIEQQYYSRTRVEREAWNAERIAEAEPVVSAVERRCHQEHLFNRILVETNLQEAELRSLLERIPPPQEHAQLLQAGQFRSVKAWREALGALAEWLMEDARQRKAEAGHAPTPTLKAIYSVLVEAMDHALLPVIIGSYGIGKSFAAKLLVAERPRSPGKPGAVRVKLRSADDTVSKCIEAILQHLRHGSRGEGGYAGLCRVLRRGDLLILDEAQHLAKCSDGRMVEVVRDLWDETGAGIALIGNPVMKRGKGGDGIVENELYGAFLNRAEVHDFTKGNSRADVEAWMLWNGLSGKALADKLAALALKPSRGQFGGLRELQKLFDKVARRNPGETVTAELLSEALKLHGGGLMSRRDWIAMVHMGPKRLGMDEATRRAWMEKHTGKRSSKDCTDAELSRLCDLLRAAGALDDGRPLGKADTGGKGLDRPTRAQWIKLKVLCEQRGWPRGIDDPSFSVFVRRIAKVDNPRFLTKNGVRAVILGLERWIEHDRKKEQQA